MNIIKSDIIEARNDVFWEDVRSSVKDMIPKPVLVLVTGCVPGSTEDVQLQKMLEVCKLTPELHNVIRLHDGQQVAWHQLREILDPKIIFLIGILPIQLGISALFTLNERNHFSDRVWLPTLSLAELEKHQDVKKQLWQNGMKPIFIDHPLPQ